jgi:hypothetical protein
MRNIIFVFTIFCSVSTFAGHRPQTMPISDSTHMDRRKIVEHFPLKPNLKQCLDFKMRSELQAENAFNYTSDGCIMDNLSTISFIDCVKLASHIQNKNWIKDDDLRYCFDYLNEKALPANKEECLGAASLFSDEYMLKKYKKTCAQYLSVFD